MLVPTLMCSLTPKERGVALVLLDSEDLVHIDSAKHFKSRTVEAARRPVEHHELSILKLPRFGFTSSNLGT